MEIVKVDVPTDALFNIHLFTSSAEAKYRKGQRGEAVSMMESVQRIVREVNLQGLYSVQFMPPRLKFKPGVQAGTLREEKTSSEGTRVSYYRERPQRTTKR